MGWREQHGELMRITRQKGKIVSLNGGMCMRAKLGGCMFLMKRGQNWCPHGLMVIFQSAVSLSQPTDTWSESLGCSRKEETFIISLGKVGETNSKVAKKMIRV